MGNIGSILLILLADPRHIPVQYCDIVHDILL